MRELFRLGEADREWKLRFGARPVLRATHRAVLSSAPPPPTEPARATSTPKKARRKEKPGRTFGRR